MAIPYGVRLPVAPVVLARALLVRVPLGLPAVFLGWGGRVLFSELVIGEKTNRQVPKQQQGVEDEILPGPYPQVMRGWPPVEGGLTRGLGGLSGNVPH